MAGVERPQERTPPVPDARLMVNLLPQFAQPLPRRLRAALRLRANEVGAVEEFFVADEQFGLQAIGEIVPVGDLRQQKVVGDEIEREPLVPGRRHRLLDGERLEADLRERDLVGGVVGEIDRDRGVAQPPAVQFDQRPGRVGTDRQPPAYAATQREGQQQLDQQADIASPVGPGSQVRQNDRRLLL